MFDNAETIIGIVVPGGSQHTRKQVDELTDWVKRPQVGMQGIVNIRYNNDGSLKSSADKFFNEEQLKAIAVYCFAKPGDIILLLAGKEEKTRKAASQLRLELAQRAGLRKDDELSYYGCLIFHYLNTTTNKTGGWHAIIRLHRPSPTRLR